MEIGTMMPFTFRAQKPVDLQSTAAVTASNSSSTGAATASDENGTSAIAANKQFDVLQIDEDGNGRLSINLPTYSLASTSAEEDKASDDEMQQRWKTCSVAGGSCGIVKRIDCRKVNSPITSAFSLICGFQPIMYRRRQHVFVMRHGERADVADPDWSKTAGRPWDPPLSEWGVYQSYQVGCQLRTAGWGITRVVCSPSLRCVQSALEVASALLAHDSDDFHPQTTGSNTHPSAIRPQLAPARSLNVQRHIMQCMRNPAPPSSRWAFKRKQPGEAPQQQHLVKISFDLGLFEVLNSSACPPSDVCLPLSALQALIPPQLLDPSPISSEPMPSWPESMEGGVLRLVAAVDRIAEQRWQENIVVVTHAEALHASVLRCNKRSNVFNIRDGAYTHLERNVYRDVEDEEERGVGQWHLATKSGTTGVYFQ